MIGVFGSPNTDVGRQGDVVLDGIGIQVLTDPPYTVKELPRFGQKISQGSLKYADFNPEEQCWSIEGFGDGYGLRNYSDVPSVTTRYGNTFTAEDLVARVMKEQNNVDARTGVAVLAPEQFDETLTGSDGPVVWQGEFKASAGALAGQTKYVAIAGTKVYYRATNGTWTQPITLSQKAVKGCCGVFRGNLVIGFAGTTTGVYTNDLATTINLQMPSTLPTPGTTTLRTVATGGILVNGTTYAYRIVAKNVQGVTLPSTEVSTTTGGGAATYQVVVTWPLLIGAASYDVYGRTAGAELFMANVTVPTFTDDGSLTPGGALPGANTTGANVFPYVFAFTADQAVAYIAGGINATDTNLVISASDGVTYGAASTSTVCLDTSCPITGLAPGGGVVLVWVGKTDRLGYIDNNAIFRTAVNFDSRLATNCQGMSLILSLGGEAARGPVIVTFPMNDTILSFAPNTQGNGTTTDLAPYGIAGFRPVNAKGIVGAIQGTSRYLYYAVTNAAGNSYVIAKQSASSANTVFLALGANACQSMGLTSLFASNPMLFVSKGNNITRCILPLNGDFTPDDSACRFCSTGYVQTPGIDNGFPDEPKLGVSIHVVTQNVVRHHQDVEIYVSIDDAAYTSIGFCNSNSATSTTTVLPFPGNGLFKRCSIQATLTTDDDTKTPQLLAIAERVMLNTQLYRVWTFQGEVPTAYTQLDAEDLGNGVTLRAHWWSARRNGEPLQFQDRDNNTFVVKLLQLGEVAKPQEVNMPYSCVMSFTLMEIVEGAGVIVYGNAAALYGNSLARYGG